MAMIRRVFRVGGGVRSASNKAGLTRGRCEVQPSGASIEFVSSDA
jgi:hypothetical protein